MDIRQAGVLAVAIPMAIAVASVVMWAGCRWWYGRKLLAAAHRLQKSEKGRLFSQQQTAQARQQIGILQAAAELEAAKRRAAQLEEVVRSAERERARAAIADMGVPVVAAQAHGFADTQILP